jgi:RyR domain
MLPTQIARVVHEANRALQVEQADPTIEVSLPWDDTDLETRVSAISGVEGVIAGNTPEESHAAWTQFKVDNGWVLGPVKDMELKQHPLLVPYNQLPESQKIKDSLFVAVTRTLSGQNARAQKVQDWASLQVHPDELKPQGKTWADLPAQLQPKHTFHSWVKYASSTAGGSPVWACDCGLWQSTRPVELGLTTNE